MFSYTAQGNPPERFRMANVVHVRVRVTTTAAAVAAAEQQDNSTLVRLSPALDVDVGQVDVRSIYGRSSIAHEIRGECKRKWGRIEHESGGTHRNREACHRVGLYLRLRAAGAKRGCWIRTWGF